MPPMTITGGNGGESLEPGGSTPTLTMNNGTTSNYLWASDTGDFSSRFGVSSTFQPHNKSGSLTLYAHTVNRISNTPTNVSALASTRGYYKSGGSGSAWDASAKTTSSITAGTGSNNEGFVEFESNENNKEKAAGLAENTTYLDPTNTISGFSYAWHLKSNGTAVPRRNGSALYTPVPYFAGDIFRVEVSGNTVSYKLRGRVIATAEIANSTVVYGLMSFKEANSTIENASFLIDTSSNRVSTATLEVLVTALFPYQPNYTIEVTSDNNTLTSVAEDGSMIFRVKSGLRKTYSLQFIDRPVEEYTDIVDFWNYHQKHIAFYYTDETSNETYLMRFDAPLRISIAGPCRYNMSISLREV